MKPPYWCVIGVAIGLATGSFVVGRIQPLPPAVQPAHDASVAAETNAARVDTVVLAKTKTLTKTLTEYQTLRDTLRITDTVWVKQIVQRCDSLRSACDDFRVAAIDKFRADSQVVRAHKQEIAAVLADRPSKLAQLTKYALVGLAGYGLGRAGASFPLPLR